MSLSGLDFDPHGMRRAVLFFAWLLMCLGLLACDDSANDASTLQLVDAIDAIEIRQYDPTLQMMISSSVPLADGISPATLQSDRVTFSADNTIEINPGAYACSIATLGCDDEVDALRSAVARAGGSSPTLRFRIGDRTLVPKDDLTRLVSTISFQLHEALSFHERLGFESQRATNVYIRPKLTGFLSLTLPVVDNASYMQPLDSFMVLRAYREAEVPVGMNRGVWFHEYHHRSFADRVYGGNIAKLLAAGAVNDPSGYAQNRLQALDEGIADFFGALGAGSAQYLSWSFDPTEAQRRDPSVERAFAAEWREGLWPKTRGSSDERSPYDPYGPGAVYSSFLWSLQIAIPLETVATLWMQTESQLGAKLNGRLQDFDFVTPLQLFVGVASLQAPEHLQEICDQLKRRFGPMHSEISSCR